MEQGLAATMTYGSGDGQNTKHYYAGSMPMNKPKKKEAKLMCKTKKPGKK